MNIEWPDGMMTAKEFVGSAAEHYRTAGNMRANNHHATAAHEELNTTLCQLAPAIISIAESLAALAEIAKQCNNDGLRVVTFPG